jgi:lipopolysaccharide export LptBFGC system permease protein LptF
MFSAGRERRHWLHPVWTCGLALVALLLIGAAFSMFVLRSGRLVMVFMELAVVVCAIVLIGALVQYVARRRGNARGR